jgi:hypothetical protein
MMDDKKQLTNNTETSTNDSIIKNNANSIEPELLKGLPPEAENIVRMTMSSTVSPLINPLSEKITPEHISKIIEN